ncbi:MAG: RHS repeat-associated core domain-containing protein [Bacteroidota bacterium]
MKYALIIILVGGYALTVDGQDDRTFKNYQEAYNELRGMLDGSRQLSLKRAIFLTENAFFDNSISYEEFSNHIDGLAQLTMAMAARDEIRYNKKDKNQILMAGSIFRMMMDTLAIQDNSGKIYKVVPFSYDQDDFWGDKDWRKMFVTKLLTERTGNCHSLPMLYKILANELDVKAWLSLAPNHTYIKQWSESLGWYNTELTTGTFPFDASLKAYSYIKTEAVVDGIYMDTLSSKEEIAYVLTDLVQGFVKKTGNSQLDVAQQWVETAIDYFPDYPNALILKAELQKSAYEEKMISAGSKQFRDLWKDSKSREQFNQMQTEYLKIHDLGYRKMPKEMYLNWLMRISNDTTCRPHQFEPTQPFKKYGYTVNIATASEGVLEESFNNQEQEQIGTVIIDTRNRKIVSFVKRDTLLPDDRIGRMYDPALGRWWVVDRLAEKYYNMSPYNFVANNPILYVDPNGDSIAVREVNQGGIAGYQNVVSQGSGGFYKADVDPSTGIVSMVSTGQEGKITGEQQKFVDEMTGLTTSNGVATVNVANNSENVVIGDIASNTIDVGDMQKLGTDGKVNAQKAMVHEMTENYGVQVKGQAPNVAHLSGNNAESRIGGGVILNPFDRFTTPSTTTPGLSTLSIPVVKPAGTGSVSITLYKNNVLFVSPNNNKPVQLPALR